MPIKYRHIFVMCPGGAMTAGPEALHQLAFDLIRLGYPASMVYFPFDKIFDTQDPYKKYKVPVSQYKDEFGDLLIFPEIVTTYALKARRAQAAIWWMSVNNYTCNRYGNPLRDKFRYFKNLLRGLRPWRGISQLSNLQHFAQSYYALDFLESKNIKAKLLSDPIPVYTSESYLKGLEPALLNANRNNIILYNPNKGIKTIHSLMMAYPQWKFVPLKGFNREELAAKFLCSKIYMDFGHHPGKDRLPREAAIHGCCIITGTFGSASNQLDVNIPNGYKLDQNSQSFVIDFGKVVQNIFNDYVVCSAEFSRYRKIIHHEQILFDQQIKENFDSNL